MWFRLQRSRRRRPLLASLCNQRRLSRAFHHHLCRCLRTHHRGTRQPRRRPGRCCSFRHRPCQGPCHRMFRPRPSPQACRTRPVGRWCRSCRWWSRRRCRIRRRPCRRRPRRLCRRCRRRSPRCRPIRRRRCRLTRLGWWGPSRPRQPPRRRGRSRRAGCRSRP